MPGPDYPAVPVVEGQAYIAVGVKALTDIEIGIAVVIEPAPVDHHQRHPGGDFLASVFKILHKIVPNPVKLTLPPEHVHVIVAVPLYFGIESSGNIDKDIVKYIIL